MMLETIYVENVSKYYKVYRSPTERLKEIILHKDIAPIKKALEGVSFSVLKGEAFGIIGDNGAGKSTLLSIIAGTLKPTSGKILVKGKVAAILELGTGFHPELSGIENIYIYGGLYGLSPKEIENKIPFIKDFSELEDFIDKPIKTYSTGMLMRLAFSTILAIDPDIFIIDEALSVGDIHFQKKVFKKIKEFKNKGGTLLFTSHSMYQISNLCDRALWLHKGQIRKIGKSLDVIKEYESYIREKDTTSEEQSKSPTNVKASIAWIDRFELDKENLHPGETLKVSITVKANTPTKAHIGLVFRRNDNEIITVYSTKHEKRIVNIATNSEITFIFEQFPILYGDYFVDIYLTDEEGQVFYDIKTKKISIRKTNFLDLGIFRIKAKIFGDGLIHEDS